MEDKHIQIKVSRTICGACHCLCGVLVHVRNGHIIKIEGDPEHPQNEGIMCPRGLSYIQQIYHPDRIKYPMKRVGERGSGKWERISWSEALDTIAAKIRQAREEYGPESVGLMFCDGLRGNENWQFSFMHALESPMICGTDAHYCLRPQGNADMATFGLGNFISHCEGNGPQFEHSKCILIWGANHFQTELTAARRIIKGLKNGAKLIVADPRFTNLAAKADIWLQVRPATDTALALGMINYIIKHELYDKKFVENYCFGFEQLKERAEQFPLRKVSDITWVPEEKICQAATMYATLKPASLDMFMGLSMHNNSMQALRAVDCLMALAGNIDIEGGNLIKTPKPVRMFHTSVEPATRLSQEKMAKAPGVNLWPMFYGYNATIDANSHPPSFFDMLLTGKPYKIKVLLNAADPVMGKQESKKVREAIKKADFFVTFDFFISPTASLADILLPAASYLEKDLVQGHAYVNHFGVTGKVIEPVGECRDEAEVFIELAERLGIEFALPMKSVKEFSDWQLKPSGKTFDEMRGEKVVSVPVSYKKYEEEGYRFPTPTGKIELYSKRFEQYGYDPLPYYEEPPCSPYSTPELFKKYPLILISGARILFFYHGAGRQIPWLRELCPDPAIEIHPETAEKLGIRDGDWVWIETSQKEGRVKQKAELTLGIHPNVVHARSHWWFPERKDDPERGCMESNINAVMGSDPPYDPISGSTVVRGCLCKIYKVEEDNRL